MSVLCSKVAIKVSLDNPLLDKPEDRPIIEGRTKNSMTKFM
jgi:hypothetical protein